MSRLILLGSPDTKRTVCLTKGADEAGIPVEFLDWENFPQGFLKAISGEEKIFLKIDPLRWDSCCLEELNSLVKEYVKKLEQIEVLGRERQLCYLNEPGSIKALLDKRECKRQIKEAGIQVTEELEFEKDREESDPQKGFGEYPLFERLLKTMVKNRIFQVFIKPVYGSGAAGVMAFRYEPRREQMVLYTCGMEETGTGRLVNTKRLRRFTDRDRIAPLAERILRLDCIVERWYAKAEYGRFSYDLRAVVQDGELDFVLARLSEGPVTNLHLNNHPLEMEGLGLSEQVLDSVRQICCRAAGCYSGLRSVGIDVLLERGSLRPRIIEMNGQGDLIYQDIYGSNRIYRKQAQMMKRWMQERDT